MSGADVGLRPAPAPGSPAREPERPTTLLDRAPRAAAWVFAGYVAAAGAWMAWSGRDTWFTVDDWDFLTRDATDPTDLFGDRNGHWATLWLLAYQALFRAFGIGSHLPYTLLAVSVHLTVAVLLRVVMRRAGVSAWTATVAAGSYVVLGPATSMIVAMFHPTLALGLGQLILVDHDGRVSRRDGWALALGALALMGHNMAVALVAAVGLAALIRRGWRAAAVQVVPLAAIYVTWRLVAQPSGPTIPFTPTVTDFVTWMRLGIQAVFTTVGGYPVVAAALAVALVLGLLVAWVPLPRSQFRRVAAAPLALLVAMPFLLASIFPSRWILGLDGGAAGRFLWVTIALTLPALAVAVDALTRRSRLLTPLVLLFAIGIPANVRAFESGLTPDPFQVFNRSLFSALSTSPLLDSTPDWVVPAPGRIVTGYEGVTVGWLRATRDSGRLGRIAEATVAPEGAAQATARLSVVAAPGTAQDVGPCREQPLPVSLDPRQGSAVGITLPVDLEVVVDGQPVSLPFDPQFGPRVLVLRDVDALTVRSVGEPFGPPRTTGPVTLCRSG